MERGFILLTTTMMLFWASGVQGTSHLSFSNSSVGTISRTDCKVTKLCLEVPTDCDPSVSNNTCLFSSLNTSTSAAPNGTTVVVQLSGHSPGYIGLGLTADATKGNTMLFICGQNNSAFFFRTMDRSNTNGALTDVERRVQDIRGKVNGTLIQCEFSVPNVNSTAGRATTTDVQFQVLLGKGNVTGSTIGPFTPSLTSQTLSLSNVTATATATNSTGNTTTSGASSIFQPHVVMPLLTVLSLSFVKRA